jgi:hypothetical protein
LAKDKKRELFLANNGQKRDMRKGVVNILDEFKYYL